MMAFDGFINGFHGFCKSHKTHSKITTCTMGFTGYCAPARGGGAQNPKTHLENTEKTQRAKAKTH